MTSGQVFWLPDRSTDRAFPSIPCSVACAAFVPGYSGGTATDLHRLPYSLEATRPEHPCRLGILSPNPSIATEQFQRQVAVAAPLELLRLPLSGATVTTSFHLSALP